MSTGKNSKRDGRKKARTIQSVDRALRALDILADAPTGLTLTALAGRLGLGPQTTQGLIRTLQSHGLAFQSGSGQPYSVGPGLARLAGRWQARQDRAALAREPVAALAERAGEYAILVELRGDVLFALVEAKSSREVAVAYDHCAIERMHTMACGKILLAWQGKERLTSLLARLRFSAYGPRAIRNRAELRKQLARVRAQGWAECRDESSEGTAALAVPVLNGAGDAVAALGCAAPTVRFTERRRQEIRAQLHDTARQVAQRWGLTH